MPIPDELIMVFKQLIATLYDKILIKDVPDDAPYLGFIGEKSKFGLNDYDYRNSYLVLLSEVFTIPEIGEKWSEDGVNDLGHELLSKLAGYKLTHPFPPDFKSITIEWLNHFFTKFQKIICYTPVVGLSLELPIEINSVRFLPINAALPDLKENFRDILLKNFSSDRNCLSSSIIIAESKRAIEIHRQHTQSALNILRYISSLVYFDQPIRHMYVVGKELSRISYGITENEEGVVEREMGSEFSPLPLQINAEFIKYANFYGFENILSISKSSCPTEIEESFLTAIQWFGEATQELNPLFSFVKYYISIEAALKKKGEMAKKVLPKRISVLLESFNKNKQRKLEKDLEDMIDERNSVLHSGKPERSNPEKLAWDSRIIARQVLHLLRLKINEEKLKSKDDLVDWVKEQSKVYLA